MSEVIDRRLNGKNKSATNRERFIKRYKAKLKTSVADVATGRSIKDVNKGGDVTIDRKDIDEPYFGNSGSGSWDTVTTGNDSFEKGDRIRKKEGGKGGGSGAGNSEDVMEDEFTFALTKDEFLELFFEDMELPDLVRKKLAESPEYKLQRAGYTTTGTNSSLHILRSMTGALARRIASGGARKEYESTIIRLAVELEKDTPDQDTVDALELEAAEALRKMQSVPFIDPIDLRYRNFIKVPKPAVKAVMFCIMDVSGSMGEFEKDIAKRFFTLLYLFLTKTYENIDVVFIRHHTQASEVSEDVFFNDRESGGTVVSSSLELMSKIIEDRYPSDDWNIYGSQVCDGDNYTEDNEICKKLMSEHILTTVQHYSYIEITSGRTQGLWDTYEALADSGFPLSMRTVKDPSDIYPVFKDLFKKAGV